MKTSLYTIAIDTFAPMLRSLSGILDRGAQFAAAKKLDSRVLVDSRLAPDMFPLSRQVQLACDHATGAAARLTGKEPPHFEDDESTIEELKARIATALDYLGRTSEREFEGAEHRNLRIEAGAGSLVLEMSGLQFLRDWALPHFYFHVVTAYDILRHNGVEIGKRDYMSHVGAYIRQPGTGH